MDRPAPKKSLGQNFLVDRNIAGKIVAAFDPGPDDVVVEIGPGQGALTGLLVESGCRLIAVELDPRMAELIRARHGDRVEVLEQDILTVDFAALARERGVSCLRVIGNIPYYITSPILFHVIDGRRAIQDAALMMQREVADRLTARPRTKDYGILSVVVQTYADVRNIVAVGPKCFHPPPKVNSMVVHLRFRDAEGIAGVERVHRRIVRAAFGQRRKTLRNSLASVIADQAERDRLFEQAAIGPTQRAEELSVEAFIRLARLMAERTPGARGAPAP